MVLEFVCAKQSRSVNFENFTLAPTIGAPTGVTIYVKSLPKTVATKSGCMKPLLQKVRFRGSKISCLFTSRLSLISCS